VIQRTPLVAPFSVKTPFVTPKTKGQQEDAGSGIARPHIKFMQDVQAAVNAAPQITDIPATSTAKAQPGEMAFDANYLYVAVGVNIWKRIALSSW
jgi:hypothetical protein